MWKLLILLVVIASGCLVYSVATLPSEERAQRVQDLEDRKQAEREDYAAENLPAGCEIRSLPAFGGVDHLVLVRCEAVAAVTANAQHEETTTVNCGKALCTSTEITRSATIQLEGQ
ncbi:hypothetical protein [Paracoccus sp. ME4]|uniref:hypothetical protein n=1 Tax=Paracoccus sp. ME4 TaxID=3138066 RepID=UPI00398AADC7